jgi:hypothetical protein
MKLLTIQNHKRLEGICYNTRWVFKSINEESDRYIFLLESVDGNEANIEIVRKQCDDGQKWLARYNNEWFFLNKKDFETPENLIKAFRNF